MCSCLVLAQKILIQIGWLNWVKIFKDWDSNVPWPEDLSQHSHQISEDLCHQKYHFITTQETEWGCDPGAAVYSVCVQCSAPHVPQEQPSHCSHIPYMFPTIFLPISHSSGSAG